MSEKISLIIPCKNEVESLGVVLEEIKDNKFVDEIIVVVDNKNDNSIPIIKNYNGKLIVQKKGGYGAAIIEGFKVAKNKFGCIYNADYSFDPKYFAELTKLTEEYDFIFGPAYKGITLASSISQTLYLENSVNKPFCYNRKEVKTHGESGLFVGYKPKGAAIIVDDVISSGKSISESINLLKTNNAKPTSVLVAFDRMEVGRDKRASIELSEDYDVSVYSIITLDDIVSFIKSDTSLTKYLSRMEEYMNEYKR